MGLLSSTRVVRRKELAKQLGISEVSVWRWERKGLLPPKLQLGPNVVDWLESEIDQWLASKAPAGGGDSEQGSTEAS